MTETPITDVKPEWVQLATDWHGGQASALYSVSSTGKVWTSTVHDLPGELRSITRDLAFGDVFGPAEREDYPELCAFREWADKLSDNNMEES